MYKSDIQPTKNVNNETKFDILSCLAREQRHMSPREIAELTGLTYVTVREQLRRYTDMGYIYRRIESRKGYKNYYCYGFPTHKGLRFLIGKNERIGALKRVEIRELTGKFVSLSRNKYVPIEIITEFKALGGRL